MGLSDGSLRDIKRNAAHEAAVGLIVHEALCKFAIATLKRAEQDKAARAGADKGLSEWAFSQPNTTGGQT
jgi:hypothetical protein